MVTNMFYDLYSIRSDQLCSAMHGLLKLFLENSKSAWGTKGHPYGGQSVQKLTSVAQNTDPRNQLSEALRKACSQPWTVMSGIWPDATTLPTHHTDTLPTLGILNCQRRKGGPARNLVETFLLLESHCTSQRKVSGTRERLCSAVSPIAQASISHKTKMSPYPKLDL